MTSNRILPPQLTLDIAVFDCFALVMELLAFAEPQLYFDVRALKINRERYECQTLVAELSLQPLHLFSMHEQLARAFLLMIKLVTLCVMRNMDVLEPKLRLYKMGKAIGHLNFPRTKRLDLCAEQNYARLKVIEYFVFEIAALIPRDLFYRV